MDICYFAAMKRLFNFLRIDIYFTVFIFLLSYLLVINSRIKTDLSLVEILRPDAPLAKFVSAFLILILIKLTIDYFQKKEVLDAYKASTYFKYFGISFILFLLISNLLGLFISTLFNTISRNFNSQTLVLTHLSRSIDFTLYGGLYLAYLFLMENNNYKAEIRKYDNALSSSVIQQLKSQLNPHFLFNNLNTLDELI
ncbi:histidine kinase [Winogradskyella epiphytica]|uniref:Histidine kinase n=1 Tax=Winogradskyella epiphytica TaxID=262005 RepID=A0A2V4XCG2_9FLAO|nr:histidine kinase [Winogradskyella epiphytica]GGW73200.1 hypothetical protein GCM10008085_26820 [Winogradskyella epiphytica]